MATSEPPVKFDLRAVHDGFSSSLLQDDDVDINFYLAAYNELYKFCSLLGTIFGFVGSDIKSKIEILESLMNEESQAGHFSTFKSMVEYEKNNDLLRKNDYVSGCRTLLRLHRGLDFIRLFLKRVGELETKDKTSVVGQEAYNETLAQYHPWLIRKGVVVSLYSLPTKENLMLKVCGNSAEEIQKTLDVLPKMLLVTADVYNRTQAIFEQHSLLDLP
ncbi:ceramide-1-phosphate transfer protein [Ischnura elegans]|uniref:ceramide-1-phosphate transfer protein n=1 Tax=Ischnura elegans TaxID=197161 RepID=UPI001ED8705D|nr:ceramide-1-phosphate transfer protein [Ischnura elegans]